MGRTARIFVFLATLLVVLCSVAPFARAAIVLDGSERHLVEELDVWEDSSATATAVEAARHGRFVRATSRPNHGYSSSAYFYRFVVTNGTDRTQRYVLDATREWVDSVDLYRVEGDEVVLDSRGGTAVPRTQRRVAIERMAFEIDLPPNQTRTYLLRVSGVAPLSLLGTLEPEAAFWEGRGLALILFGLFYGALLGMAVYSAIAYRVLRDEQGSLATLLFGAMFGETAAHGHLSRALSAIDVTIPTLELRGSAFAFAIFAWGFARWARVPLDAASSPRIDRLLRALGLIGAAGGIFGGLFLRLNILTWACLVPLALGLVVLGAVQWRRGVPSAKPYLVAVSVYVVPGTIVLLTILGIIPLHPLNEHSNHVGAVIMTGLFSLLASQQTRTTKSALASAKAALEDQLKEAQSLAEELRHQVVARSRELSEALAGKEGIRPITSLASGELFGSRYRVVRTLGAGGMGAVYEVKRTGDDRRLALKVLASATSSASAVRFAHEAEIGAKIRHENLVPIVDVGLESGRTPYLVMHIIEGGSLEDQRERFGDVAWALGILRGVARGLAALHHAGVVHRDLKPSNILMDGDVPRIADFGIAKSTGATPEDAEENVPYAATVEASRRMQKLTATGAIVGTPLYMAPEALRSTNIGPAADLFAFGLIAWELLTGSFPFAIFTEGVASLRSTGDLPAGLHDLLIACLMADPEKRPSANELASALDASAAPAKAS